MTFRFSKINFNGDSNIGLYGFATDDYCVLGTNPKKKILDRIKKTINVDVKVSTITGTELIGLFASGNSNGMILTKIIEDYELKKLKKLFGINLEVIKPKETALGNLILCNDNGCIISKSLEKFKKTISDVLGCDVVVGKVANLDIVGSASIASNTGCLCHREATEDEMKKIEKLLKVKVDVGTVGYGSPFIKSGLIVNSKGILYSEGTTGAELGRMGEVFENE
jgi:translation initiation factor 6